MGTTGRTDPQDVADRPHVRFDGHTLSEIGDQRWAHAQNDALGYFLWLSSTLAASGALKTDLNAVSVLTCLVRYFAPIRFWQDEDSGHWEEQRKVSASGIGTRRRWTRSVGDLLRQRREWRHACGPAVDDLGSSLAERGRQALDAILPGECAQLVGSKNRRYDAALLFLLFPLGVITDETMADLVLQDVSKYLAGEHGIRRYLGDWYWAPDYAARLSEMDRTRDCSDDLATRDMLLSKVGGVAIARRAQSRIARDRSFISIARSRRSLTTGVAPSCTTFDRTNTSPTRTSRCSGRRRISS